MENFVNNATYNTERRSIRDDKMSVPLNRNHERLRKSRLKIIIISVIISEYKQKYENFIDLSVISSANELIAEEDKVWKKFNLDQNKAIKELKTLANKIKNHVEKNKLEVEILPGFKSEDVIGFTVNSEIYVR